MSAQVKHFNLAQHSVSESVEPLYVKLNRYLSEWAVLVSLVRLWRLRAAQRRQLASLDDRLLKDIGVSRYEVNAELQKYFWQP